MTASAFYAKTSKMNFGLNPFFFLGEGLQAGGHFFLFTGKSGPITGGLISWGEGLKAVVYACARHSSIGEGAKRTKLTKPCFFNALLLTI